ncbi:hypothetical protein RYX36_008138 [Vicia faba]
MRNNLIEDGITDPLEFPLTLDALVGLTMTFKVKWKHSWDNEIVVSIYQDEGVIKQIQESLRQALDLDITSKHNPLLATPSQASKRVAPQVSTEDTLSSIFLRRMVINKNEENYQVGEQSSLNCPDLEIALY